MPPAAESHAVCAAPDGDPGRRPPRGARGPVAVSAVIRADRPKRQRMVGDDEIGPFADRLAGHRGREREAGHHAVDRLRRGADEQADRVPLGGQPQRGDAFEGGGDGWSSDGMADRIQSRWRSLRDHAASMVFLHGHLPLLRRRACLSPTTCGRRLAGRGARASRRGDRRPHRARRRAGLADRHPADSQVARRRGARGGGRRVPHPRRLRRSRPARGPDRGHEGGARAGPCLGARCCCSTTSATFPRRWPTTRPPTRAGSCSSTCSPISAPGAIAWGATLAAEAGRSSPRDLAAVHRGVCPTARSPATSSPDRSSCTATIPSRRSSSSPAHIGHVHATDAVAGAFAGRGRAVILGTGQVDLPNVLARSRSAATAAGSASSRSTASVCGPSSPTRSPACNPSNVGQASRLPGLRSNPSTA